jgi:hypothetical protein
MRRVILSSVACPALQYFSTLSHKRHGFRKKIIEHKMNVLTFSTRFVRKFLILRRIRGNSIIKVHRASCKIPVILPDLNETKFFGQIFEKY